MVTDSGMLGDKFGNALYRSENLILSKIVKEPSPSNLVNGTKIGCQNMVNGTKNGHENWLAEQKLSFKYG